MSNAATPAETKYEARSNSVEVMEGRQREQLEGWIPSLASEDEIRQALEKPSIIAAM